MTRALASRVFPHPRPGSPAPFNDAPMLDAAGIIEWVRKAKAGDMAVYARGETLSREVATVTFRLAQQGLIDLAQRREHVGRQYLMQRRSKAYDATRRARRSFPRASAETVILRMIEEAIRLGQPCPTNAEFAKEAGLAGGVTASYRLRKLVAAGKIVLVDHGPFERRVAVLVATGGQTVRARL